MEKNGSPWRGMALFWWWLIMAVAIAGIIMMILGVPPKTADADDAVLGRVGEAVRPLMETPVEMTGEEVKIRLGREFTRVDAVFTFHNSGAAAEVLMGFPEATSQADGGSEWSGDTTLHDFEAFVDGEKAAVERRAGLSPENGAKELSYPAWHTFTVPFEAGQTREVRNTYRVKNGYSSEGTIRSGYILTTGSVWKGSIGLVRVTVEPDGVLPYNLQGVSPAGYGFAGDNLVWEWKNCEPDRNIEIMFKMYENSTLWSWAGADPVFQQNIIKAMDSGDYGAALTMARDYKKNHPLLAAEVKDDLDHWEALLVSLAGGDARNYWEAFIDKAENVPPEKELYFYPSVDLAAPFYFLGRVYAGEGRSDSIRQLYEDGKKKGAHPQVGRWLLSLLPEGTVAQHKPEVRKLAVVAYPARGGLALEGEAGDADGDLDTIEISLWYLAEGRRQEIEHYGNPLHYNRYRHKVDVFIPFSEAIAGHELFYTLRAVDGGGRQAEASGSYVWNEYWITFMLNNSPYRLVHPPAVVNDRVLLAAEDLIKMLEVEKAAYSPGSRTITLQRKGNALILAVGGTTAYLNGKPVSLEVPAEEREGSFYLPLRFTAGSLGVQVDWDEQRRAVLLGTE
ncbi:MAG: copper amine oxidase N-terminal domain-containing protein [Peptococcaceae bacterium]|nr:MAG: copper amine oxidase N-terminal domain-containing protein [Peptococcaceae bacterium]